MSINPYRSPAAISAPPRSQFDIYEVLWACIVLLTKFVVVGCFVLVNLWCVQLYRTGQAYSAGAAWMLVAMFVFALAGDNWVQRIAYSASVPFFVAGAICGIYAYLQLGWLSMQPYSGISLLLAVALPGLVAGYAGSKCIYIVLYRFAAQI